MGKKAYALDLRERVVKFMQAGGSAAAAGRRLTVGRSTVYCYLAAVQTNTLAPQTSWGTWRKLAPAKLQARVKKHPDATLQELAAALGASHNAVWVRLNQLGCPLKKTHQISRTERSPAVALPARVGKTGAPERGLSRRVGRGSPPVSRVGPRPKG